MMKYLVIVFIIFAVYLAEFPKIFHLYGDRRDKSGCIACHAVVALMSAGTLVMLNGNSGLLIFALKDFFPVPLILSWLGLIISLSSIVLILFKKAPSRKE